MIGWLCLGAVLVHFMTSQMAVCQNCQKVGQAKMSKGRHFPEFLVHKEPVIRSL